MPKVLFIFISLFFCFSFSSSLAQNLVLTNVRIIDVETGQVLKSNKIEITNGRIVSFNPKKRAVRNHAVLDGGSRFVLPGLFEMHAHVGPQNKGYLESFLQHGVTGVRVMAGTERLLAWRDSISRGLLEGPALFIASPLYDGNPPLWGDQHTGPILEDVRQVEALVREHKRKGYHEIKVYNRLPEEVYLEILRASTAEGIHVTGHLPYTLTAENFGDPRHHSIEHLDGFVQYAATLPADWEAGEAGRSQLYARYEKELFAPFAARLKENNVWLCPTLSLYGNINSQQVKEELEAVKQEQPAAGLLGWWSTLPEQVGQGFRVKHDFNRQVLQDHFLDYEDRLLVGTDSPNPYNLPGLAVHHELQYLVETGFSQAAVLRMATVNAATYLGVHQDYGSITPGKIANLVLLDENPLLDIRHTKRIHLVLVKGEVQRIGQK